MRILISLLIIVFILYAFPLVCWSQDCISENIIKVIQISEEACIDYHKYRTSFIELLYPKYTCLIKTATIQEVEDNKQEYQIDRQQLKARTLKTELKIDMTIYNNIHSTFGMNNQEAGQVIKKTKVAEKVAKELLKKE